MDYEALVPHGKKQKHSKRTVKKLNHEQRGHKIENGRKTW
jgi:hypothetical protein